MKKIDIERLPRCDSRQTDGFFLMLAIRKTAMYVMEQIPERLNAVGMVDTLAGIRDTADMAARLLAETYPQPKQVTMWRQADHLRVVLHSIADPNGVKNATYVDSRALGDLLTGCHENCKMCSHPNRCKSCKYGKAFDAVAPKERKKGESWAFIPVAEDE